MSKQNIRLIFLTGILLLCFLLFNAWETSKIELENFEYKEDNSDFKSIASSLEYSDLSKEFFQELSYNYNKDEIVVDTSLVFAKISLHGGDITFLSLKKYPRSVDNPKEGVIVFDSENSKYYIAQSGLLSEFYPDSKKTGRCNYSSLSDYYTIENNMSDLIVKLEYISENNTIINKIYAFKSYSYEIDVKYNVINNSQDIYSGRIYGLISKKKVDNSGGFLSNTTRSYEGSAIYTKDKPYKKLSFDDMNNKKFYDVIFGGWIAMLEHYFLSAWIPAGNSNYIYGTEQPYNNIYTIKYISESELIVSPGEKGCIQSTLFVGPKMKSILNNLPKGLNLAVDYGILWPIASPIFLLLNWVFSFINNWGISIILVTLIIKVLFYHLSSISYRSMGNMKKLQPRLEILKNRYKDDKKKFGQAMMELYRKEKVNPLSGCLPILIQIPVFISLYYVLIESVELRHAPFVFWLNDLSDKDSYYVLPVVMAVTMFIQQKLNPTVQDPVQAKVIMFMPLIFLFICLQFPSGLILYWIVNNILSILQQWLIMKSVN